MTTVLLIGVQDQEANQLESDFTRFNHDLSIVRLPEVGIPSGIDVTRSVAVLSGMAEEGLLERIEAAVELSLAVIVLMPKFVIRDDIDVSHGHIDFCFAPYRAGLIKSFIAASIITKFFELVSFMYVIFEIKYPVSPIIDLPGSKIILELFFFKKDFIILLYFK